MNLRKTWAIGLLLAIVAAPAAATEFIVCNKGTIPVYAATASHESEFLVSRVWWVRGWYEIRRGACSRLYDTDEPFYFAFSFRDSRGEWGAARFKPERDSMWQTASDNLCVARGEFDYKRGGGDPVGPCKDGYFRFPGTLVFYPDDDYSSLTLDVALDEGDRAYPVDLQPLETGDPDGSRSRAEEQAAADGEPTFGDQLLKVIIDAASDAIKEGVADAVEQAATSQVPAAPDPTPAPPAAAPASSPSGYRILNAKLFGADISRTVFSGSPWLNADGSSVEVFYEVEGQDSSELFDAPTQRSVDDPEVSAALTALNGALASIVGNRPARITSEGRLKYDFEAQGGMLVRRWVNVAALDFARARKSQGGAGFTGFVVPCNGSRNCVIALDQDPAGNQSNQEVRNEVEIFFATDQDGQAVWAALQRLRSLYPAAPVVTVN
jgi:uncharacterized membrane protein